MFDALRDIACFVTAFVSFLYGTRVAWVCGKKCQFNVDSHDKSTLLLESIPSATAIYFFGFLVLFSNFFSGFLTWMVFSITSAILLATLVVSMAMPELKRKPSNFKRLVLVELKDGTTRSVGKMKLNVLLASDKVAKFKRSDGWVVVGKDRLRAIRDNTFYTGSDRREII